MNKKQMKNPNIRNVKSEILMNNRFALKKVTNEYQLEDGTWQTQIREVYDKDDGATILLYNEQKRTIILTRQFRIPTYLNGNASGMLIETCAGLLDGDDPEVCARKEALEETGYKVKEVKKVFEAYMSPGAITSILHFFIAPYTAEMKVTKGGGQEYEQEDIEVIEIPFDDAYNMIGTGEIRDGKTIMLLLYARLNSLV
jgi:nudix-type nucleoside diphosphatase (YffH/AdpP family)